MTELEQLILDELSDLLDLERLALLKGDIDAVGRVLDTKEKLLTDLANFSETEEEALLEIKGKLERNHVLIENAMRGIQAVAQRFSTIRRVRKSLETYDRSGQRLMINISTSGRVEKRA